MLLIALQKIERLKSNLHLIGVSAGNTHTLFVEHADDVAQFDAAAHFDTHEEVLGRAANRPRSCTLHSSVCTGVSKRTVDQVPRARLSPAQQFHNVAGQQEARRIVRSVH